MTGFTEVERLREWKAEAMTVLGDWEAVWEAAGRPGQLGGSKAQGVREWVGEVVALLARADSICSLVAARGVDTESRSELRAVALACRDIEARRR
jgi:hypothetical protein